MDDDVKRELDRLDARITRIGDAAYSTKAAVESHVDVCAERYDNIIERLDRPALWFGRIALAATGLVAVFTIIEKIRGPQ